MAKLFCTSCGSTDVNITNTHFTCKHCSSTYLLAPKKTKLEILLNINIKYTIIVSLTIFALSVTLYKYYISQNFTKTTSYIQEEHFTPSVYYPTGELHKDNRSIDRTGSGISYEFTKDGILKGEWMLQEGSFVMGKRFYKTGELHYNFRYEDGEAHGIRKEYYTSGELKTDTPFVRGSMDGIEIQYFRDGRVKDRVLYKNNKIIKSSPLDSL